ncbi:hypothetical protein CSUI_006396 [Cystoisospora suis]|uniref:Uncharacterized protein n=1 Tax=Cystoisospora suis TaxID=483139 RepID=A0A2C6KU43_9APIC|nr:hypothetical protein CSUI_006396 [Cystoisospora suis]
MEREISRPYVAEQRYGAPWGVREGGCLWNEEYLYRPLLLLDALQALEVIAERGGLTHREDLVAVLAGRLVQQKSFLDEDMRKALTAVLRRLDLFERRSEDKVSVNTPREASRSISSIDG